MKDNEGVEIQVVEFYISCDADPVWRVSEKSE